MTAGCRKGSTTRARCQRNSLGALVLLFLLLYPPLGSGAEQFIPLDALRQEVLYGTWSGDIISCNEQDCIRWRTRLILTFEAGPSLRARWYSSAYDASWPSVARFTGGRVILSYRDTEVPFDLVRNDAGRLQLIGSYHSRWLWFPRENTVRLLKQETE